MTIIKRAILSVYDKTGLVQLASFLANEGVTLFSTGGTATLLAEAQITVTDIASLTGFPEILDGRVKTLHPHVHGGILASSSPEHQATIGALGILPFDLVVVNLYPFEQTIANAGILDKDAIEMIDIGGPAMLRAAAKNHGRVVALSDPADYGLFMEHYAAHTIDERLRRFWATKVFAQTARYDAAIAQWLETRA